MTELRRELGFWPIVGDQPARRLFWSPEARWSLVIGAIGGFALTRVSSVDGRMAIAGDYLVVLGALLGIVFAALALVTALFSDDYLLWLAETEGGVKSFIAPFIIAIGVQVGCIILAVGYRAAAEVVPPGAEQTAFIVASVVFVFALLDVVALTRNVLAHAIARSMAAQVKAGGRVRRLDDEGDNGEAASR